MNQFSNGSTYSILEKIFEKYPSLKYEENYSQAQLGIIISEAMYYQRISCGRTYFENKNKDGFNQFTLYNSLIIEDDCNGKMY